MADKRAIVAAIAVAVIAYFMFNSATAGVTVERVIDGDTLVLNNGERVRLLGMDCPEKGQYLYQEAKDWLVERVEGRIVTLESAEEDRDHYGRLLRFVWMDSQNLDLELVRLGYASMYYMEPGDLHYQEFLDAEASAKASSLGIWEKDQSEFCIAIHLFNYNPSGDDRENLERESVTLRNKCTEPVEMTGWTLQDNSTAKYIFPEFTLQNKSLVTIRTGQGEDSETGLYWGRKSPVWNNQGDVLNLYDIEGRLLLYYIYY